MIGARTGSKDLNNNVVAETFPGALRPLVGATVEEYGRQNRPDKRPLALGFAQGEVRTEWWYEALRPDADTDVVASWQGRHLTGEAAVTSCRIGRGAVLYVGTYFTAEVVAAIEPVLNQMGALPEQAVPMAGVETVVRSGAGGRLRFFINHNETPSRVLLPSGGHELISDVPVTGEISLAAGEVAVVWEDAKTT